MFLPAKCVADKVKPPLEVVLTFAT